MSPELREIRALSSKSCDTDHELKGFEGGKVGETQGALEARLRSDVAG